MGAVNSIRLVRGKWIAVRLALGFRFALDSSAGANTEGYFWEMSMEGGLVLLSSCQTDGAFLDQV